MPSILRQFRLPDLIALSSSFPDATSPHWKRASSASQAWVNSYNIFSSTDQRNAFFTLGQSELLVSHAYPYADYEEFRTCCDFVNLLFVLDEISDVQSPGDAWETGKIFLNVLEDPEWDDGSKVASMTRDLRTRLDTTGIKPNTLRRLIFRSRDYVASVVEEAALRERGEVLPIEPYIELRRNNSAVLTCFALIPYVLGIDLPDEAVEDPTFEAIDLAGVDMVCWANDLYSYDMEQSKGIEGNNILTVLMETHSLSIQDAADQVGEQYKRLMQSFIVNRVSLALRSFGSDHVDKDVKKYLDAMQHWPRGNLSWSFETPRYFGKDERREEVIRTGIVILRPKGKEAMGANLYRLEGKGAGAEEPEVFDEEEGIRALGASD